MHTYIRIHTHTDGMNTPLTYALVTPTAHVVVEALHRVESAAPRQLIVTAVITHSATTVRTHCATPPTSTSSDIFLSLYVQSTTTVILVDRLKPLFTQCDSTSLTLTHTTTTSSTSSSDIVLQALEH